MQRHTRWVTALISAASLSLAVAPTVSATQSVNKSFQCTITAKAPVLSGKTITTFATIVCAKAATVTIDIKAVELDGTSEQTNVVMAENKSLSVSVSANVAKTVSTTGTCANTETGNEEFATKARVGIGTSYSSYDRTTPANDSFLC